MKQLAKLRLAAVAAIFFAAAATPALPQTAPDLDPVVAATVRVDGQTKGRSGTGWVIEGADSANRAGAAVIVTSLSVVEGSTLIKVREPGGGPFHATILYRDGDRNLAFLEVKGIVAKPIPLARTAPALGRSIWATGFNREADESEIALAATATVKGGLLGREYTGPISTDARANVNQIEHDAAMLPGFEGGPLVDQCGRVVGMNMKSGGEVVPRPEMRIASGARSMNALKADEVIAAANTARVDFVAQDGPCSGGAPVARATGAPPQPSASEGGTGAPSPAKATSGMVSWLKDNLLLVALILVGAVAALFGIVTLTRRSGQDVEDNAPGPISSFGTIRPEPAAPTQTPRATTLSETVVPTTKESELRLTGRGPGGEAIDIRAATSEVAAKPIMLGVGENADLKIPDKRSDHKVSRMHAQIGHDGKQFTIADNKSLNGTKVGSKLLEPHVPTPLVHGDTVTLADVDLKVSII